MKEKMFPALPEPKTPPRAHNGPFLKSRLPRLTPTARASCPGGVVFSSPTNCSSVYPLRSSPVVVAAGQPTLSRSLSGGPASDGEATRHARPFHEEITLLQNNKFSPTTVFKVDEERSASGGRRRKKSLPIHVSRPVCNANSAAATTKEFFFPVSQPDRLAKNLRLLEEAKEKKIRRDLAKQREAKSITLTGGEATLLIKDNRKLQDTPGYVWISPDKLPSTAKDLLYGKNLTPKKEVRDVSKEEADENAKEPKVEEPPKEKEKEKKPEVSIPVAAEKKEEVAEETSIKKKEKRRKRRRLPRRTKESRDDKESSTVVTEKTATDAVAPPPPRVEHLPWHLRSKNGGCPVVLSSSDDDAPSRNKKKGDPDVDGEKKEEPRKPAPLPPRLRKLLKKRQAAEAAAAAQAATGDGSGATVPPPKPVKVVVKEVSDLLAFVDLETKTQVKKHFLRPGEDTDKLVDLAALKSYAPSGLSEDMVKYLETLYGYFSSLTPCSVKEACVLLSSAKRLNSKKNLLARVNLTQPIDSLSSSDVKEYMVKFSSWELCGQVTSKKLKAILSDESDVSDHSVMTLEENMETYLCKDNPRTLHKLDFFTYLPYLLCF